MNRNTNKPSQAWSKSVVQKAIIDCCRMTLHRANIGLDLKGQKDKGTCE
jgi:hypothetical protein